MERLKIFIPDMQSAHCKKRIENALQALDQIELVRSEMGFVHVNVKNTVQEETVLSAIQDAGYSVGFIERYDVKPGSTELKFTSTINCFGCVSKVANGLDAEIEISDWKVDVQSKDKILTVNGNGINANRIQEIVAKAGFKATPIQ